MHKSSFPTLTGVVFASALMFSAGSAQAYTYTFLNTLDRDIVIDFTFVGGGPTAFKGAKNKNNQPTVERYGDRFVIYRHSAWLKGPQVVKAHQRASFQFMKFTCFHPDKLYVAVGNGGFVNVPIQRVPSAYMNSIVNRVGQIGSGIGKTGDAIGKIDDPRVQAAGQAVSALSGILEPAAEIVKESPCKSLDFVVGADKRGTLMVQTAGLGGDD